MTFRVDRKDGKTRTEFRPRSRTDWIASALSRLFERGRQRHDAWMLGILLQFLIELIRALVVDSLSGQLRGGLGFLSRARKIRGSSAAFRHVHKRNRDRLLHRLHTAGRKDL